MYPHGAAHAALTPNLSRPRIIPIPRALPVPLHVTSSRKVHRTSEGIINIIQEISFYAESCEKSLAGKQLKEVHAQPEAEVRGRFSAETNARVFVGERLIRMLIQTAIRPNTSDSLEIDEVFHFSDNIETPVVPIAFEATLERSEGQDAAAVEFDLSSPIVVTLKQRILKDPGEQYKVLQAIELRANESETRPTQELARRSTLTQPMNESAQFRERIFAGADVLRVDRDIIFVCDRPILSLAERREYIPCYPAAPRRRSASLTQSVPRLSRTPNKPRSRSVSRSRSASRSWAEDSNNTADCRTANEDLPTATSPYSLREDPSCIVPPCNGLRTARDAVSPLSSGHESDRESRSKRKKWTVNSVIQKAGAATPERYERARTVRNLSTARNLSMSPYHDRDSDFLKTAKNVSPNGEIPAIQVIPIVPNIELGPHGECTLVEGTEVLKVAAPADSLVRTCNEGCSPRSRSESSRCSTANQIPTCASFNENACQSSPYSSSRSMPRTGKSSTPCTPLRTARNVSPYFQRDPSSAALDKRRVLFGYGTRPATTPTRSSHRSPSPAIKTGLQASPMQRARRVVLSPVHTAVHKSNSQHSRKSQKASHKESKHSGKRPSKPRLIPLNDNPTSDKLGASSSSSTNLGTARNLFGSTTSNESASRMFSAKNRTSESRTARERSHRSPAVVTARARSIAVSPEHSDMIRHLESRGCPNPGPELPPVQSPAKPLRLETWEGYENKESKFGKHGPTEQVSPFRALRQERNVPTDGARTATEYTPTFTAIQASPMSARVHKPRLLFGDVLTSPPGDAVKTARPRSSSPYEPAREPPQEQSATALYYSGEKTEGESTRTARAHSYKDGTKTARSPAHSLKTARASPYNKHTITAHVIRSPAPNTDRDRALYGTATARSPAHSLKTARNSPYEKTARDFTYASPARGLPTACGHASPAASFKTAAARSSYERTARSPATSIRTASGYGRSPAPSTARLVSPTPRSVYLAPQMARDNDVPPAGDGAYTTARAVSPAPSRGFSTPRRPSMTARDETSYSPVLNTARDALNSTQSCISGGEDSDARWTARSARSPITGRGPMTDDEKNDIIRQAVTSARGICSTLATSRTQSPATRSAASNIATAREARSPHVDTESSTRHVVTARVLRSPAALHTGRQHSRGVPASPANLKTARSVRSASRSPMRTAATPEHNTMPDSHARQEDSYSEQSQFTYQKTPSGFTQKPTHSPHLNTGLQRTPTKTEACPSMYYSARQTTPSRTRFPDDVPTLRSHRTPARDYSEDVGLDRGAPSPIRTAVAHTPSKKQKHPKLDEMPKCSLKTGCQAVHTPRKIPAGPDSDGQDSPNSRPKHKKLARTPSAPVGDMRTPRTARAYRASPASSSLHRSPAPSSAVRTAVSPDAASYSNYSNEDTATARPLRRSNWAASNEQPTVAGEQERLPTTSKPRVVVRADQVDGKIFVEVALSFKLNTTGTIRLRGEMVHALQPRAVSVNGQKIWSDSSRH